MTIAAEFNARRYVVQLSSTYSDSDGLIILVVDNWGDVWRQDKWSKEWTKLPDLPEQGR